VHPRIRVSLEERFEGFFNGKKVYGVFGDSFVVF